MTAYGGFQSSEVPYYSGTIGKLWLERGGAFVLANIRGGGEYGPDWHKAALREKRQNSFDDLEAVARDVMARGIARRRLGGAKTEAAFADVLPLRLTTLFGNCFGFNANVEKAPERERRKVGWSRGQ